MLTNGKAPNADRTTESRKGGGGRSNHFVQLKEFRDQIDLEAQSEAGRWKGNAILSQTQSYPHSGRRAARKNKYDTVPFLNTPVPHLFFSLSYFLITQNHLFVLVHFSGGADVLMKTILHCCDISNPAKPLQLATKWSAYERWIEKNG